MATRRETVDFEAIESQKENIQSLPGGRSAKKLAELYSTRPLHRTSTPTGSGDTNNITECIRAEYEAEVKNLSESDDPLDVFDRYVRWTLDTYPSAQATPQSQLHTLLERATKAFLGSAQYKNDLRYLKLWLHYIHFFAESPRETFMFLSRHGVGYGLALFYEEYAAWLEGANKLAQAEEVYKAGIEREARPVQRLLRKFKEFEDRTAQRPEALSEGPSSPPLPTVRPALASKSAPFSSGPQQQQQQRASREPIKSTIKIFSDVDAKPSALGSRDEKSRGWESISSLAQGRKENTVEPKPWVGETLKAGGKKQTESNLIVFKDALQPVINKALHVGPKNQIWVHPQTGVKETIFVDLRAIYVRGEEPGAELSFEEIVAANRGLLDYDWSRAEREEEAGWQQAGRVSSETASIKPAVPKDARVYDENGFIMEQPRQAGRKKKMREVNETQIIKAKLDSPSGRKMRKRESSEPTMTIHTRAATDDIYDIYNAPLAGVKEREDESIFESFYEAEECYTTDVESNATSHILDDGIGEQDEKTAVQVNDDEGPDGRSLSEWSDFSPGKHIPSTQVGGRVATRDGDEEEADEAEVVESEMMEAEVVEAEMVEAVEGGRMEEAYEKQMEEAYKKQMEEAYEKEREAEQVADETQAVDEEEMRKMEASWPRSRRASYFPPPPDDFDAPTRPFKDATEAANNRLPFMTPITERTEYSMEVGGEVPHRPMQTPCKGVQGSSEMSRRADRRGALDLRSLGSRLQEIVDEQEELPAIGAEERAYEKDDKVDVKEVVAYAEDNDNNDNKAKAVVEEAAECMGKVEVVACVGVEEKKRPAKKPAEQQQQQPKGSIIKGPIITEELCNPVDDAIRREILSKAHPPLASCPGFFDHSTVKYQGGAEIRRFAKAVSKAGSSKGLADKAAGPAAEGGVVIEFEDSATTYSLKRELGAGAFAPVYLVQRHDAEEDDGDGGEEKEGGDEEEGGETKGGRGTTTRDKAVMGKGAFAAMRPRGQLEALKMEAPPSAWEFHMMRVAHARLGPHHRAAASLSYAHEMHLYLDEGFLLLPYHPHGTLLDVVNAFRAEACGVMDEALAMWFAVELLRTVEALHARGVMHGDIKPDNCLVRIDGPAPDSPWRPDGSGGWASRGLVLIDFGRAIDMRAFAPVVQFVADWKTTALDCAEMRDGRPWTWQLDYHGLAGTLHCLLFGRYMDTTRCDDGGFGPTGRRYRLRDAFKRYWQTQLWSDCFDMLLNPVAHAAAGNEEGGAMPLLRSMRGVRERMERWLEDNGERGVGLRSLVAKVEAHARSRK